MAERRSVEEAGAILHPERPGPLPRRGRDPGARERRADLLPRGPRDIHSKCDTGVAIERPEARLRLRRAEIPEEPASERVGHAAPQGEGDDRIGRWREGLPLGVDGERPVRPGARQRPRDAQEVGVGEGAGPPGTGKTEIARHGLRWLSLHGHTPGEVAQERPVGRNGLRGPGPDERRVGDAQPASHRTGGGRGVTPLLRSDAGVLREGRGQRETQRAPRAQAVDRRQRRRDGAAGADLAGAGTSYFLAGVFFAAAF